MLIIHPSLAPSRLPFSLPLHTPSHHHTTFLRLSGPDVPIPGAKDNCSPKIPERLSLHSVSLHLPCGREAGMPCCAGEDVPGTPGHLGQAGGEVKEVRPQSAALPWPDPPLNWAF